ncbi:MAG: thioredoxin domain-containing protein [Balneolaceae bacterium]|nr:thioredoxin domain-containing protein [Balneolaceae bacterium]
MNHLSGEESPYLLQHVHNPVDWYPWGEEAFAKAREENKPVFLSIGYATCHWCHVMAHESFEDEEVAELMNQTFVNIKADREERPDIDNTYMTICQMLTGQGGWPLTIIMTPEKEPFYAATYLPKHSRANRIGMLDLVPAIENAWLNDRNRVMESVERIKMGFTKTLEMGQSESPLPENIHHQALNALQVRYDSEHGGFGGAPKFPSPHNLSFLIQYSRIHDHPVAREMAEHTLQKMRLGGIYDHIGGGFHRYSTDDEWLLPHFEKMLYDQALMLGAYAECYKLTGSEMYRDTCRHIVNYLDECMTSPEGGYYSAEDADSEGEEGTFYVWKKSEIVDVLGAEEGALFCELYNIRDDGNYYDEATRQKTGANIPYLTSPVPKKLQDRIGDCLDKLHKHRKKRERPLLDDKILTDWNGLMIGALARAGIMTGDTSFIQRAEKAYSFISKHLIKKDDKRLLHRYRNGDSGIEAMADDYAFLIDGLIELYQATFKPGYLTDAVRLQKILEHEFWDEMHGGYYFTSESSEEILGRQKEIYDGAFPSSNSVAAKNGLRLSRLTGNTDFENRSHQILNVFSEQIADAPAGYTHAIHAAMLLNSGSHEIVICSENRNETCEKLIAVCRDHASPGSSILLKTAESERELNEIAPFTKAYPVSDRPEVYVCSGFACKAPVHTPGEVISNLSD